MRNGRTQRVWVHQIYVHRILYQLILNTEVYYRDVPIFCMMCIQASFAKCDSSLNRQDKCGAYLIKEKDGGEAKGKSEIKLDHGS